MFKVEMLIIHLNKFKFVRIIKWLIAHVFFYILKFEILCEEKFFTNRKKKRLFLTTGNLSLVNCLAIIEQLKDVGCKDYLIIESGNGSYDFWKRNYEMAQIHNFKKIRLFSNCRYDVELILSNFRKIDEVFMLNYPKCTDVIPKIYPKSSVNLIDEGFASLIHNNIENIKNFKYFYTYKYINKIDGFGFTKKVMNNFVNIDTKNFQKVSKIISSKYPIKTPINFDEKNILYCGIYWTVSGLDKETFIKEQTTQIESLIKAGYKILYKPHPRDTEFYGLEKNPDITFIKSVLPLELYSWDVLAAVGMNCTSLVHINHYHNIPTFSHILPQTLDNNEEVWKGNLIRFILKEYSPNYENLLKLDAKNMNKEDLKNKIKEIYDDYLKNKPLLSQNERVKEYVEKFKK